MFPRIIIILLSLIVWAIPTAAQQHRSVLRAETTDAAGQPASGIRLRLISEATGEVHEQTSDQRGRLVWTELEPGNYTIESKDDRYRGFVARVAIAMDDVVEARLPLSLPSLSGVDARPSFLHVDRTTAAVRTRFDAAMLSKLPLDGRNIDDLACLAPGVTAGEFGPIVNGAAPFGSTGFWLDGFDNGERLLGRPVASPIPDAVSELEILTASYDARFGRTAGAQMNVVTKSGTNSPSAGAHVFQQTRRDRTQAGGFAAGPLARDRTFVLGDYEFTRFGDDRLFVQNGHRFDGRVDHVVADHGRVTARYSGSAGPVLDRTAHNVGLAHLHVVSPAITNDARFGYSRVTFADIAGIPGTDSYQVADTVTLARGSHVTQIGGEWLGVTRDIDGSDLSEHTSSGFVQNDWRATAALSVSAGLRLEHSSASDEAGNDDTSIAPRIGVVWGVGREMGTVIRGGYGRFLNQGAVRLVAPRLDQWSVSAQQQVGRGRTIEAVYIGSRMPDGFGEDGTSRYNGIQFILHQRSDTALTTQVAYTIRRWTTESASTGERIRSRFDSRDQLTVSFVWSVPVGKERALLSNGLAGEILSDLELSGIVAMQSGRPRIMNDGPAYRSVDLAILKNLALGGRTVQLRFETFNFLNRQNPPRVLFDLDPFGLGRPEDTQRRYQFAGKVMF